MARRLSADALLARLVAFDSTSSRTNLPLADFICEYVDRPGVRIERHPSPDGSKVNLVLTAGPETGAIGTDNRAVGVEHGTGGWEHGTLEAKRLAVKGERGGGLVLSGHMDVVPAEEDGWRSDPFRLTRHEDTYVARGACDMKGFLTLAINHLAAADPASLRHPLVLILTYDEELGSLGARHLVETWRPAAPLPRAAIIGEPTGLAVVRMHKGHLRLRLTLQGVAAHSAYPHLGRNAIEPAGPLLSALTALRRALERERPPTADHFPDVPFPSLNIATIAGGSATNIVPDRCTIQLGIRMLPGMESAPMVERVRGVAADVLGPDGFALEVIGDNPPMIAAEDAPVHRALCAALGQTGSRAVSFGTDAGWLQRLGLDCVLFGPGSIDVAHRPNEFIPIAALNRADEVLGSLVHRFTREAA